MNKKISILIIIMISIIFIASNVVFADAIDGNTEYTNFKTDEDCNMEYTDVYTSDAKTPTEKVYIAPHTEVKEQLNGDCFAFGIATTIESSIIKKTGYRVDLSEEHIANIHYADQLSSHDGAYLPLAVANVENNGVVMGYTVKNTQSGYEIDAMKLTVDYDKGILDWDDYRTGLKNLRSKYNYSGLKTIKVDAHYIDLNNVDLVKKAIKQYGAVVCALNIDDFSDLWCDKPLEALKSTKILKKNGEWITNKGNTGEFDYYLSYVHKGGDVSHCVSIIGWNDYLKCFIFKNSYGVEKGGESGYGLVKYHDASLLTDQGGFVFDVYPNLKPFKDTKKVKFVKKVKITKKIKTLKSAKKLNKNLIKKVKKANVGKLTFKFKKGLLKIVYYKNKPFTNYRIV